MNTYRIISVAGWEKTVQAESAVQAAAMVFPDYAADVRGSFILYADTLRPMARIEQES